MCYPPVMLSARLPAAASPCEFNRHRHGSFHPFFNKILAPVHAALTRLRVLDTIFGPEPKNDRRRLIEYLSCRNAEGGVSGRLFEHNRNVQQ